MTVHFASALLSMSVATAVFGCDAFGFEQSSVKTRAANDFNCDSDELEVKEIGNHSFKVTGCKHKATYTCIQGEGVGESQYSCMREK